MGFNAIEGAKIEGARGLHDVDVLVNGEINGISFVWIIECKAWNSNVPKEKVLALQSIVNDVGADRGFLLSEKGFQSGAIRLAEKSNIILSSIADLTAITSTDYVLEKVNWRIQKEKQRLRHLRKLYFDDMYYPPMIAELGELGILESMLADAMKNEYPIRYRNGIDINNAEELIKLSNEILGNVEQWQPTDV